MTREEIDNLSGDALSAAVCLSKGWLPVNGRFGAPVLVPAHDAYLHAPPREGVPPNLDYTQNCPRYAAEDTCPSCGTPSGGPGWYCDACAEVGNHLPDA